MAGKFIYLNRDSKIGLKSVWCDEIEDFCASFSSVKLIQIILMCVYIFS